MGDNLNDLIEFVFCYDCDIRFRNQRSFVDLKITTRGGKGIEYRLHREDFKDISEVKFAVYKMLHKLGLINDEPIRQRRFTNNEPLN
jgi:fructose-specific phosphotransferase system component IIB